VKKVRVTVKKGSLGKKIPIFNSPESLYVWLHDPELYEASKLDETLGTTVTLNPGEIMEVEWMGCEFIHENSYVLRVDQIRLAKTMKIKALSGAKIVGVHNGWTTEEIISFKSGGAEDIRRMRLTDKSKHKFNIEELFASKFAHMKEQEQFDDSDIDPQDLH